MTYSGDNESLEKRKDNERKERAKMKAAATKRAKARGK